MSITSIINASIQKAPSEVLYSENTPLPINFLLSRESSINLQAHKFAIKIKMVVYKVKSAIYNA